MTEEEYEALLARVAALETTVASHTADLNGAYTLSHSGEEDDESIDKVMDLTVTIDEINKAVSQVKDDSFLWGKMPSYTSAMLGRCESLVMQNVDVNTIKDGSSRAYPLVLRWGSRITTAKTGGENGTNWIWPTFSNALPTNIADGYVIVPTCDWGGQDFEEQHLRYEVNGRDIKLSIVFRVSDSKHYNKTFNFKVGYVLIGKATSGGGIIG